MLDKILGLTNYYLSLINVNSLASIRLIKTSESVIPNNKNKIYR